MDIHQKYMQRAMELARLGLGSVSPNPMVGCVVVHEDKIIGEGFHRQYGGPHAEVHAIDSVQQRDLLSESTVYVNLEPCAHYGKTPPCANLLVASGVKKVIIANVDPNPQVAGKGIAILKNAGVDVEVGIMASEGLELNRRFFNYINHKKPYVILKWAETADGFIARPDYTSKWISNEYSRKLVHKWRTEESAVLVGRNTALRDNPMLNARHWPGKNPLRIVLDRNLQLSRTLNLFSGELPTICYNIQNSSHEPNLDFVKLPTEDFLSRVLDDLYSRNIQSLLVEGGAATLQAFINEGLWDEARVFQSSVCFGDGISAPQLRNARFEAKEIVFGDTLTWFKKQ
ncbi:MAG: bifunctional diaminohydroxyphosphoribosylaminopyrimidine deaminase/5-amino-6-(5-phosphoribosylamino)uracil reductase RibD [Cyclobacteriaceae bacterium]|nr:bifunctional diaminohydroxyphosphoribosylaminopyrimidine deaminase/5-amino-6-(5-phosphoribosylamino)uracil reductase RibD [Cyclobacteriaceae bacterium]